MIAAVGPSNGFFVEALVNGHKAIALVDTGSAATFMSDTFAKRAGVVLFPWIGKCYHLANGQKVKPAGNARVEFALTINAQTRKTDLDMYVLKNLTHDDVIGANIIRSFGITINGRNNSLSY